MSSPVPTNRSPLSSRRFPGRRLLRQCTPFQLLFAVLGLLWLATPTLATQQVRVTPLNKADYERLRVLAPELGDCGTVASGDAIEFVASDERAAELRAQGFAVETVIADLEAHYRSRFTRGGGDFGLYHTFDEAIVEMDALQDLYPTLMSEKFQIGTTLEGRSIWMYKLSDNVDVDEDEPEVFFNAYIHAREAITFEVVYDLANKLLSGYGSNPRYTSILNGREIFIQPCVNPDGVQYNATTDPGGGGLWRKNRRNNGGGTFGVDLNRNWGHEWGYDDQGSSPDGSSEIYRGTGPFSEPETQAVRQFVNSRHFNLAINYHSYSNLHIFTPGEDKFHTDDYDELLAMATQREPNNLYDSGCAWELLYFVNGDANGWMTDETIEKPTIFAYVTEVGTGNDGFWPLESRIPALVAENLEGNLRTCELADNPKRALTPNTAAVSLPDTVGRTFTMNFSVPNPDPDNPAVTWNLIEATNHSVGSDDVEGSNPARWSPQGFAVTTARSHTATHSWHGGTLDSSNQTLTSMRGHLVQAGEQLSFWTWYRTEPDFDYCYVEVSTDGRSFVSIPGSISTNNDPNRRNLGNGFSGTRTTWTLVNFPLTDFVGQVIWVRFRYNTDGFDTREGWYIDDIAPTDLFAQETQIIQQLATSQYGFTNHIVGTYYYLVQANDGEGQQGPWSPPSKVVIITTVDVETPADAAWRGLELRSANPFGESADLRFDVPGNAGTGEVVSLTIHDVSGRQLTELVRGQVGGEARGASVPLGGVFRSAQLYPGAPIDARWSAAGQTSGIYFARLRVGDRVSERRLVRLR